MRAPQPVPAAFGQPAAAKPRRAPGERAALFAGWVALAVSLLLAGCVAARYRDAIAAAWPRSAAFYAAIGMPVDRTVR